MMIKRIFFCLIAVAIVFGTDECKVTFYNVGQGNCTLFRCPNGPAFLIDAGSTWSPDQKDSEGYKQAISNNVALEVLHHIYDYKITDKTALYIIISHYDEDHYNWIKPILERLQADKKRYYADKSINITVIFGGKKEDYENLKKDIDKFKAGLGDITWKPGEIGVIVEDFGKKYKVEILISNPDFNNKNDNSLVVKLEYDAISILTTGDITGNVTKKIPSKHKLKSNILLASHHGADSDDSNDTPFLQTVSPQYIVFSAGMRSDYSHPKAEVVKRILNGIKVDENLATHLLQFYEDLPLTDYHRIFSKINNLPKNFKPFARLKNGYIVALTDIGIFDTYHGSVQFTWKENDKKPQITIFNKKEVVDKSDEIEKELKSKEPIFQDYAYQLKNVASSSIKNQHSSVINSPQFPINQTLDDRKESIIGLRLDNIDLLPCKTNMQGLNLQIKNLPELISLDISNNNLSLKEVEGFINIKTIRDLDIINCLKDEVDQINSIELWGSKNKGFNINSEVLAKSMEVLLKKKEK